MLNESSSTLPDNASQHYLTLDQKPEVNYNFPVELRRLRTEDGIDVPHSRAVVRTDKNLPIATVSDKYRIIQHQTFLDGITPFVRELGEPELKYHVLRGGAYFAVEYVFRNHTVEIGGKNRAALRIMVSNAYFAGHKALLRVAALVLECLNCAMFSEQSIFELGVRHAGDVTNFAVPTPEKVLAAFTSGTRVMNKFSGINLTLEDGVQFLTTDDVVAALPERTLNAIVDRWGSNYGTEKTAWDLLQHSTYEITHNSPRLTYTGRLQRLQKTARLFNQAFAGY